jgi:hypothetical protein
MKFYIIIFSLLLSSSLVAHPGIGIVKDSRGNIYYTDLFRVWKITADGNKTAVVSNVHTHELFMDANDDLYGEHLWYNGEQADTWGHYAWCLLNTGKLDTVIKPTAGFLTDYSFVRDGGGNMYWVQRFTTTKFKKKTPDGRIMIIGEGKFKHVKWLYATTNGTIYFADLTDLYKLADGKFTLLAKGLHERTSVFEYASLKHNVYGIWTDKYENIYVAIHGGQVVKKITQTGEISNVVYTSGTWRPDNGIFDDAGNLWLLESNAANEVRVRKIEQEDLATTPPAFPHFIRKSIPVLIIAAAFILAALLLFYLGTRIIRGKNKKNTSPVSA